MNGEKGIVPAGVDHTTQPCFEEPTIGPHQRSHLYVGVNPPWDKNPFFFGFHHLVSNDCGFLCQTDNTITNLYFASASYECFSGDRLCITFMRGDSYKPKTYLDLAAGRAQIQQTQVGGQSGYAVKSGPNSWIGNIDGNEVDMRADCQWVFGQDRDSHVGGSSWLNFVWNKTNPLDYELMFINSSAAATLTTKMFSQSLNRFVSTMALIFEGSRNDTQEDAEEKSFHDLNPIQLNTGQCAGSRVLVRQCEPDLLCNGQAAVDSGSDAVTTDDSCVFGLKKAKPEYCGYYGCEQEELRRRHVAYRGMGTL